MTSGNSEIRLDQPASTHLQEWADELERGRWPGWIADGELKLTYVSPELKIFMSQSLGRDVDDAATGVGQSILEAMLNEAWTATIDPQSLARMLPRCLGFLKSGFTDEPEEAEALVPEPFKDMFREAQPVPGFGVLSERFDYTIPGLPAYPVEFILTGIRAREGHLLGVVCVSQMGLRPTLVSLLARGDERMFERMAQLQEPTRCQGAILFADLQGSSRLSRLLPTSTYFSFIRKVATGADNAIAANGGVVGRHAGDGVSGFFLGSDGSDPSQVAASAIAAAREIHERACEAIAEVVNDAGLDAKKYGMNIGLHWGASLYMGQLVPGGRLDVTALGDSVNECARIQEAAENGALLASKQLIEQLTKEDATGVGLELDRLVYRPVAELANVTEKAVRDAGLIPVTRLESQQQ